MAGYFSGPADFGAGIMPFVGDPEDPLAGDFFVATYADDGALRWVRNFGRSRVTTMGVAVDGNDGIAVVGQYSHRPLEAGDLVLGEPERDDPRVASSDIFVLALDRDGAPRWMHRLGGGGFDFAGCVAVGPGNDVVVAGESEGRLALARFAADGTTRFATYTGKLASSTWFASIGGVAVDLHGDILVAGYFSGDADLGGGAITGVKGEQAWVAKYSGEDGAHLWSRHIGALESGGFSSGDLAKALLVDELGDVLIAGQFAQGADLGEGPISATNGAFLMKLAGEDGANRWARAIPTPGFQVGSINLSFAPEGRVALIASLRAPFASLRAPFDLGGGSVDEDGTYVATYEPDTGAFVAQRRLVEPGEPHGFTGQVPSVLDATGHLTTVMLLSEAQKSKGWNGFLLAHLPF
ncbi:hypothetical protein ACSRUE_14310 [Sorangium sp. KYC3313]|uniref:hypothetical protein n=1 Tax=Sorangium sp. KYC3313 TaxID=3449740 RepID=UPI003F8BCBD0